MDADILSRVCAQIYSKYPEVNGVRPKGPRPDKSWGYKSPTYFYR